MVVGQVHLWQHFLLFLLQMTAQKRLDLEWICLKVSLEMVCSIPTDSKTAIDRLIFSSY